MLLNNQSGSDVSVGGLMGQIWQMGLIVFLLFGAAAHGQDAGGEDQFFEKEVFPVLQANCLKCHGAEEKVKGGLHLTSREKILEGGDFGPAVDVKEPEKSLILEAINYDGLEMPPTGKLPKEQIDVLTKWVKMGVPWSEKKVVKKEGHKEEKGPPPVNEETKSFWAFQPVKRPSVPRVNNDLWGKSPIDRFIWAKLEGAGLKPNPPAEKVELLRRAYYDLIGLPPSPEQVSRFLADESPDAFAKVVDELLASPQYGERWGRHWLDLVRYAETNSYERDGPKPEVWRYRDYVIDAFNNDKPYAQFIREQLAGDEMPEGEPEDLIATGYYRLGIWQDEPVSQEKALYDDLDDIIMTTAQVFMGLTVNCARCHDHKLDPIPQKDYYRFLAFFSGINRYGIRAPETVERYSLRPIATREERARFAEETKAHRAKVRPIRAHIKFVDQRMYPQLTPVEREDFIDEARRADILSKNTPELLSEEEFEYYRRAREEVEELERNKPAALKRALCITEIGRKPRDAHVLIRGNETAKGEKVEPGFLSVLSPPEAEIELPPEDIKSSGRRTALAKWIASEEHPLTARVMVNRIWQYHFGRGIVRSSNDFGFQGIKPTHRELLDWLAAEFVAQEWRMKSMHKLMMLSAAYQMSSRPSDRGLEQDPENNLFWRFNMRRLGAEEIRDSILAVNGTLNPKMGGPSMYPDIPYEVKAGQSMPGSGWGKSPPEEQNRRSIYIHIKRSLITPIISAFDGADPDATCPVRFTTTQPTQALGMMNGDYLNGEAAEFAAYLTKSCGENDENRVTKALERAWQRPPSDEEVARGLEFLARLKRKHGMTEADALKYFCLMVYNTNEFVYLD